ncbi:MAG: hypothetical protein PUG21_07175 [Prevotella sp.]|nr:hypothetical protein [Prevotella sp.]
MKKHLVAAIMLMLGHAVASASDEDMMRYDESLELAARLLSGGCEIIPDGFEGMFEMRCFADGDDMMSWEKMRNEIGYTFRDFDHDGENELVIGSNITPCLDSESLKTMILVLYVIRNGKPEKLFSSTYRRSWFYMQSGQFYMTGEESAACVVSGMYSLNDKQLCCEHFWFSGLNSYGDHEYYHSFTETINPKEGTKLDYTMDTYNINDDNNLEQTECMKLTPFSSLRPVSARQEEGGKVRFTASHEVGDFKVMKLSDIVFNAAGLTAKETVMQSHKVLKEKESLSVYMPINGDIPEYAISYTDPLGYKVKMTVAISGKDGSIVFTQYGI